MTRLVDVYHSLENIGELKSRSAKKFALAQALQNDLFARVCVATYDPYVTYGVTGVMPSLNSSALPVDPTDMFELLDKLARRDLSGNAAKTALSDFAQSLNPVENEVLSRIIDRDLRAGFTAKTINAAKRGLIPSFNVMLAQPLNRKNLAFPVAIEPKIDGVRSVCIVSEHNAMFFSRMGNEFPAVAHLADDVCKMVNAIRADLLESKYPVDDRDAILDIIGLPGTTLILDGEIVSGTFNKTVGDIRRQQEPAMDAKFIIFDVISDAEWHEDTSFGYQARRACLSVFRDYITAPDRFETIPSYTASCEYELDHYYKRFRARGLEGAMVKELSAPYQRRRSSAWQKMKNESTLDLLVTGCFEGTGKYVGKLGGLIVDFSGVEVRVGGGFTDQQRTEMWESPPIGKIVEVEFHETTPDGSLRHPRFVCVRFDKEEGEDETE